MNDVPHLLSLNARQLRKLADAKEELGLAERNLWRKAREGREGPQDKRRYKQALDALADVVRGLRERTL
jgi:hypothetical protein